MWLDLFPFSAFLTSDLCPVEVNVDLVGARVIGRVGDLEETRGAGVADESRHSLPVVSDVHAKVTLTSTRAVHCRQKEGVGL